MARPKKVLDFELISKLAEIMCTQEEIATICECDVRTLQRNEEFCRVFKKGQEQGKMSLRRKQWKLADKNAAMAIFLGKQYLGQSDKVEQVTSYEDLTPLVKMLKLKEDECNT